MANALYPKGKEKILTAGVNFVTDAIKAVLVSTDYVFSGTHEFLSALGENVIGEAQALADKSVAAGVFNASDPLFPALASGPVVKAMVLYKDTGAPGASPLLAYIDSVTGFPAATNGSDFLIRVDSGPYKLFSL